MRDRLQKIWQLFLLLFDSVESSIKRQSRFWRALWVAWIAVLFAMMLAIPATNRAQMQQDARLTASEPIPEPAIATILAAFDKYEVVALPQGHGMQDLNDLIFSLIRNPAFSQKVNDIEVEFGNTL